MEGHGTILECYDVMLSSFSGAWIITGGTATGVMQFVGEAVRDHLITLGSNDKSVVALGIASWGCVANRNALDGEEVSYHMFRKNAALTTPLSEFS